jgi:prophage regulatory protein
MDLELMGPAEIAALFGVSRQRVTQLVARPDFPPPAADLSMGKVWQAADVRAWGVETGRLDQDAESA